MSNIVTARRNTPVPAAEASSQFDVELKRAQAIASAGDMIPNTYRNKPGAVLLAQQWADAHNVDLLTTMQTVAFVHGRPVIDATMQRALAAAHGYDVRVVSADATRASVRVTRDGEHVGEAAYSMDDARTAGLASKDNWKKDPTAMLVARATTRAVRWFAPSVLLGVLVGDEADEPELVEVLTPQEVVEADDVVEAEVVEPEPAAPVEAVEPVESEASSLEDLRAAVKAAGWSQAQAIRRVGELAATTGVDAPTNLTAVADDPTLCAALLGELKAGV